MIDGLSNGPSAERAESSPLRGHTTHEPVSRVERHLNLGWLGGFFLSFLTRLVNLCERIPKPGAYRYAALLLPEGGHEFLFWFSDIRMDWPMRASRKPEG